MRGQIQEQCPKKAEVGYGHMYYVSCIVMLEWAYFCSLTTNVHTLLHNMFNSFSHGPSFLQPFYMFSHKFAPSFRYYIGLQFGFLSVYST